MTEWNRDRRWRPLGPWIPMAHGYPYIHGVAIPLRTHPGFWPSLSWCAISKCATFSTRSACHWNPSKHLRNTFCTQLRSSSMYIESLIPILSSLTNVKCLYLLVRQGQNSQKSYFSWYRLTSSSIFGHKEWRYEKSDDNYCERTWIDLFEYPNRFSVSPVVHEIFAFKNSHFYRFLPIFWPFLAIFW